MENFKPRRKPVSYRKPRFCKRRVWMQVKVKNSHELKRIQAIPGTRWCFGKVCIQPGFVVFNCEIAWVIKSFSRKWQCLFSLGSKTFYTRWKQRLKMINFDMLACFMNQFNIELDWKFALSFTPTLACS